MTALADRPHAYLAPAKLNLFLHVLGRRDDGYHLIQSAMQLIDLADRLIIAVDRSGRIARGADVDGIPVDEDLAVRAARLLKAESGTSLGASITVDKRIPVGGGLGGGSSDAATVLLALDHLWGLGWPRERLIALGLRLGADVPFFVAGENAFVEGIGERLTPMRLPPAVYALVHPGVAVPTAAIFGDPTLTRNTEALKISDFSDAALDSFFARPGASQAPGGPPMKNDLEPVAAKRFGPVRDALSWLSASGREDWPGALGTARMSGSGACVFRPFADERAATACLAGLPPEWRGWTVRTLDRHPHRDGAA